MPEQYTIPVVSLRIVREREISLSSVQIKSPDDAYQAFKDQIADADRECFVALMLDTKNNVTAYHVISIGTINSSSAMPREVFKAAILSNAASLILAHNHPSGKPQPSPEDQHAAGILKEAGKLLDIPIMDMLVIGDDKFYSFKEHSIL